MTPKHVALLFGFPEKFNRIFLAVATARKIPLQPDVDKIISTDHNVCTKYVYIYYDV